MSDRILREAHYEVMDYLKAKNKPVVYVPQGKRVPIEGHQAHKWAAEMLKKIT